MTGATKPEQPPTAKAFKVLVVDDEELILTLLDQVLADDGYRVRTAESALRALELMREEPADLVVTDIRMPGMDGLALSLQLRQDYPDTRIILITGYLSDHSRGSANEIGVEEILKKPFKSADFLRAVGRVAAAGTSS
ncbi:MAG TPA: response regulator [Acidobacteriota bacterium]|nr:response regulator [Acidobacteriota bacterium]